MKLMPGETEQQKKKRLREIAHLPDIVKLTSAPL